MSVEALRATLRDRFPDAVPLSQGTAPVVATGIPPLDALLPGGGLPRGCLTSWSGVGGTAVLRRAAASVRAAGERAVWVDAARTLTGWGWVEGVGLVHPRDERGALAAAEELARSGGFALVVLTGVGRGGAAAAVRLGRVAREGGSALVVRGGGDGCGAASAGRGRVGRRSAPASSSARLRLEAAWVADGHHWRPDPFGDFSALDRVSLEVRARATGWARHVRFSLAVEEHENRLSLDPRLVDRRGVDEKRTRREDWRDDRRGGGSAHDDVLAGRAPLERAGGVAAGSGAAPGTGAAARPALAGRGESGRGGVRGGGATSPARSRVA